MFQLFQFIGKITPPAAVSNFGDIQSGALGKFLTLIVRTVIIVGGIYALLNLLLAGYAFISAGSDPKAIAGAWAKIWQTVLGLVVMAGAFVLAAIFGQLIFGDWSAIINPSLPTL